MLFDSIYDEKELLNQLRAGDKVAFTRLYQLHSRALYLNLLKLIKSEPAAEEILQDIFLLVWEKRETITIQKCFRSYVYKIAENKACDFFRKLKRDKKLHDYVLEVASGEYAEMEDKILHAEELKLLNSAMECLPPQRKKVFYLCKIQGESYMEVSRLLGISTSTINDHIVKATRIVRDFILTQNGITAAWLALVLFLFK